MFSFIMSRQVSSKGFQTVVFMQKIN